MVAPNSNMWLFSRHLGIKGVIHPLKSRFFAYILSKSAGLDYMHSLSNHPSLGTVLMYGIINTIPIDNNFGNTGFIKSFSMF